ncbi:OmpA family protein [Vibrio caribbeanicus]|uniref:OmpA family protein n=1 Tax=Vibrio caribbeanicus TaxID=701175 RepID=UPI002283D867|nr:OmpA family protein [Vibrio caribbeanicus]MCY9844545.1 OmpA family protein [Vibrio caribbeanicus]
MGFQFDQEVYLFGAFFEPVFDGFENIFPNWHQESDLTTKTELDGKIRPIPLTPIMVNALSGQEAQLWGTTIEGKIVELGMGEPLPPSQAQPLAGERIESEAPAPEDKENFMILHPGQRIENIQTGTDYELSFPPVSWLSQMIAPPDNKDTGASDVTTLAEHIKHFATYIDDGTGVEKQSGVKFKLTEIKPSQLAPKYQESIDGTLSDEQRAYNAWYQKQQHKTSLRGFIVPRVHTCAVLFTDPFYAGAEVTLVQPLKEIQAGESENAGEKIIATHTVTRKMPEWDNRIDNDVLPSALLHLDPNDAEDGFYLIRVTFREQEWLDFEKELYQRLKLPESVIRANVKKSKAFIRNTDKLQDVYTYELHERLVFKDNPGVGKLACVCGDMITLEETLIQQFPSQLPEYSVYASKGVTYQNQSKPGLASLSLSSAIMKTYDSLSSDFLSIEGAKLYGTFGDMAKTIGQALWENAETGNLPDFIMSGLALKAAFAASKDAQKQVKLSKSLVALPLSATDYRKLFLKKSVIDIPYIREAFKHNGNTQILRGLGRLSHDFLSGNNKAFPLIQLGLNAIETKEKYDKYADALQSADQAYTRLQGYAEEYLSAVAYLRRSDEKERWKTKAEKVQDFLGKDAQIYADAMGVVVRINFKFNSAEFENETKALNSNYKELCKKLRGLLVENPDYQVALIGHGGPISNQEKNLIVSQKRVDKIKAKILEGTQGKERDKLENRLVTQARGKAQLLPKEGGYQDHGDQSDEADIAVNRRVEVRLVIPDFSVTLPPSRTGTLALNRSHQYWEGFKLTAKEAKQEAFFSAIDVLATAAIWTPASPIAAYYLAGKTAGELLGAATDFFGDFFGNDTFKKLKETYKTKNMLKSLSMINKELVVLYWKVNEKLEKKRLNPTEVASFLESQANHDELLKRFLLRAYALNSLVELLAILKSKEGMFRSFDDLIERYEVDLFIEKYVMSDNWSIPVNLGNTLALYWINRRKTFNSSLFDTIDSLEFGQGRQVHGSFNTGFPVQSRLFLNNKSSEPTETQEGLKAFCHDFDLSSIDLSEKDIGFSRLLVREGQKWEPYVDWLSAKEGRKLRPQTRVMLQIILTGEGEHQAKSMFLQEVSYCAEVTGFNTNGPAYDVLFTKKGAHELHDPDGAATKYFEQQQKVSPQQDEFELHTLEFEPTYTFGHVLIHGLKPLCPYIKGIDSLTAFVKGQSVFEYVLENDGFDQMSYSFLLAKTTLALGERMVGTYKNYRLEYREANYGTSTDPSPRTSNFNGQTEEWNHFEDTDFLIEDFVMSESSSSRDNTPHVIKEELAVLQGIEIDGQLKWGKGWTEPLLSREFDWNKESRFAVCFALLGDELASNEYETMQLNWRELMMKLKLKDGPTLHSAMHYCGEVNVTKHTRVVPSSSAYNGMQSQVDFELDYDKKQSTLHHDDLAQSAIDYLQENAGKYSQSLKSSDRKHIYVVRFDFSYVSPTGSLVKGMRPFGDIVDGVNLKPLTLVFESLQQVIINDSYPLPNIEVKLPAIKNYMDKPWTQILNQSEPSSMSVRGHWNNLESPKQKQAFVDKWITEQRHSLKAPQVDLLQI